MYPNIKASEAIAVLDCINPISQSAGTVTTGWIKADKFSNFLALVLCGVLGSSATVDAKIQQANTSGGGSAKDVSGKSITQLVKASNDNNSVEINLRTSDSVPR